MEEASERHGCGEKEKKKQSDNALCMQLLTMNFLPVPTQAIGDISEKKGRKQGEKKERREKEEQSLHFCFYFFRMMRPLARLLCQ